MAKLTLKAGTTSKDVNILIQDSSVSTGAGKTGIAYNTSGLTAYYHRQGSNSATAITLATKTLGTWATGGFVEVSSANMPGLYELGIPDAALASGATWVVIMLFGVANMAPVTLEVELSQIDNQDSVRNGMTALPNANANATGGLAIVDSSGAVKVQSGTGANQISLSSGLVTLAGVTHTNAVIPTVTTTTTATNVTTVNGLASGVITATSIASDAITAAKIADGAIDAATFATGAITATAIASDAITAAKIADGAIDAATFAAGAINAAAIAADAITDAKVASDVTIASVTGSVGSVTGAVGSVTGNVGGNVTGSVGSVTAAVTVGTINANVITATSIASDAITAAKIATDAIDADALAADAITEIQSGLATPTNITAGTITTVLGDVEGNVLGNVASVTGAVTVGTINTGAITAASIATDAIDADALASSAVTEITSGISLTAPTEAEIWSYTSRTLTSPTPGTTTPPTPVGGSLAIVRAVSFDVTITGMTIPENWVKIYLTVKQTIGAADSASLLQMIVSNPSDAGDGLLYLNGADASSVKAQGTITVDQEAGSAVISITDDQTLTISAGGPYPYDMKVITDESKSAILTTGIVNISSTPTLTV